MDSSTEIIAELIKYVVIPGLIAAAIVYGIVRRKRAMASTIKDDVCVSCDSEDVTMQGQGAYRCNACGYEGGSGRAAIQHKAKQEALEALDPAQRRSGPVSALARGAEGQQDLAQCVGWFRQAQSEIQAAIELLGQGASVGFDVNLNAPVITFDWNVDKVIASVVTQQKLKQAHKQGQAMLLGVDQLLEQAQGHA
jgi:ribosomal protein L37AE/L43A